MRFGSIDIGTNTILLLVADTTGPTITNVVRDEQVIARLGKGVDKQRVISPDTFERVGEFLESYKRACEACRTDRIIAIGTSALRDAANQREFCETMRERTGLEIEILSGEDEAEWTYRGAIGDRDDGGKNFTVLDIGGGSTEIISGTSREILHKVSLDMGCVRITERFLRSSPPTSMEISDARNFIRHLLGCVDLSHINMSEVVGVAGTVTTLAAIQLCLERYDPSRVHGLALDYEEIKQIFNQLRIKTLEEIARIPQISSGRGDIILAGVFILLEFMEAANLEEITVSDRGLRYGMIMREVRRPASVP